MGQPTNTPFKVLARKPLDDRQVVAFVSDLDSIPYTYDGLVVFVAQDQNLYIKTAARWVPLWTVSEGVSINWGNLKGNILAQTDLASAFGKKFDKTGGTIAGNVSIFGELAVSRTIVCSNIVINGSQPSTTN